MRQQTATSTDDERNDLRSLIEQRTKEWELKNGKVKTLEIVRRDLPADYYDRKPSVRAPSAQLKRKNTAPAELRTEKEENRPDAV